MGTTPQICDFEHVIQLYAWPNGILIKGSSTISANFIYDQTICISYQQEVESNNDKPAEQGITYKVYDETTSCNVANPNNMVPKIQLSRITQPNFQFISFIPVNYFSASYTEPCFCTKNGKFRNEIDTRHFSFINHIIRRSCLSIKKCFW